MTVEPTKLNPRRLRSLLNASDSIEVAGISRIAFQRLIFGRPSTNLQRSRYIANFLRIELAKCTAIPFPLFEHDRPTEPGLRCFEHKKLKVFAVIVDWHTPFAIVILEHKGIVCA